MNPDWFSGRLRELREERGLTQDQLATKAGITKDGLARLERRERMPAWDSVLALAVALGVSVEAFTTPPAAREAAGRGRPRKTPGVVSGEGSTGETASDTAAAPAAGKRKRTRRK